MSKIEHNFVEVCIFKFESDAPWYLLLRRSKDQKMYPGLWQFVSGTVEGRETATEAALRELHEETGLIPKDFWVVPFVNSFYVPHTDCINLSPVFAVRVENGSEPKLSAEHSEYLWLRYEDAVRKLVWQGQRQGLRIVHEFIVRGEEAANYTRLK